MKIDGWRYYNHAAIPTTAPHEDPYLTPIEDKSIWQLDGDPLLARWTTDFDLDYETNWWYVIKDTPFDISSLKAKRRYEVNKGIKNYKVIKIDPQIYAEEIYEVQVAAFSSYSGKYRPTVDKRTFLDSIEKWNDYIVLGAFSRENNELCGYAQLSYESDRFIGFNALKAKPEHEKNAVNAGLVEGVLSYFDDFLKNGGYICDGARSINHETAFQDYLEKYFEFKKAYCNLHVAYNPKIKWIIKLLYPFRKLLRMFDRFGFVHKINAILMMEQLVREKK